MTDHIDYTQKPEVLAALDWQWMKSENPEGFGYYQDLEGEERIGCFKDIPPTMQELWDGLCRIAKDRHISLQHEFIPGALMAGENRPDFERITFVLNGEWYRFMVSKYGTLTNAIAAALHWVLQQGKENADE
jgi:hypothetical protein